MILADISQMVRDSANYYYHQIGSREFAIDDRMAPLRMLCIRTLSYILKVNF